MDIYTQRYGHTIIVMDEEGTSLIHHACEAALRDEQFIVDEYGNELLEGLKSLKRIMGYAEESTDHFSLWYPYGASDETNDQDGEEEDDT